MKSLSIAILAILLPVSASPGAEDNQTRNKVEGTWEHILPREPELLQVKVINQDHFIWVTYQKESRIPLYAAGGTYTLDGDTYKERVEFGQFGSRKLQEVVGNEQIFHIQLDGDTLTVTGTMSNGQQLREVWTRVKPKK